MTPEPSISARFDEIACRFSQRLALTGDGRAWSYAELHARVLEAAHAITLATGPGNDCVAVLTEHSPEMVIAILAVLEAGKVSLAIHPQMPEAAQRAIVRDAAPVLMVTTLSCAARARTITGASCGVVVLDEMSGRRKVSDGDAVRPQNPASPPAGSTALATIVYTSGTTGAPKGVVKSHRMILHRVALAVEHDGIAAEDRQSLLTHASFAASEVDMFGALLSGAALCVFDLAAEGLSAFGRWIDEERITVLHPPALLFRRFLAGLEGEGSFPTVRLVALAGDVVLPSDVALWQRRFSDACAMTQRFSTTETGLLTLAHFDRQTDVAAPFLMAGRAVAGKTLTVVDDDGVAVAPGETGALVVKSRHLADGYWRHPEETAAVFRRDPDNPHCLVYVTGDRGRLLPDGRFVFMGRRDHQVKIRGYRVDIREVEAALMSLAGVREAAVVPHDTSDERRLVAFVVTPPGQAMNAASLREQLEGLLPPWKVPSGFRWRAALPTTLTGKLDRQRLAEMAGDDGPTAGGPAAPRSTTLEDHLLAVWCAALRVKDVGLDDDFVAAGGDSIAAMTILVQLERRYGVRVRPAEFLRCRTIRDLAALVRSAAPDADARAAQGGGASDDAPPGAAPVEAIQPEGCKPPFFFLHGWGGGVLPLLSLARELGPDQPTYGLQAVADDGSRRRTNSLEEIATQHVANLRAHHPHGPYYLGGHSVGGLVAYEVARQLLAAGQAVGLLVLLDSAPSNLPWRLFLKMNGRHWLARTAYHTRQLVTGRTNDPWRYLGGRLETVGRTLRGQRPHKAAGNDPFSVLAARYRPGPFPGPAVLFVADAERKDLVSAWRHLVPDRLEVHRVPGTHETMLDSRHLTQLAAGLRLHLAKAHARERLVATGNPGARAWASRAP